MIDNKILETLRKRRSCRKYKQEQITDAELDAVLEAGTWAPTGMGKQSPKIIAIQNKEIISKLSAINAELFGRPDFDPFYGAPTVILVMADTERLTCVEDGSLVLGNMMIAAESIGLGSCWIHRAKQTFEREDGKPILKELGVEGNYVGVGYCILGYSEEPEKTPASRKSDYISIIR